MNNINNQIILDAFLDLKKKVQDNHFFWKEPYQQEDPHDGSIYFEFMGNGPQGSEPARFLLDFNEDCTQAHCSIISRFDLTHDESDIFNSYLKYLELNNWKDLTVLV